ncbi:hypothetical protein ILYODFUR_036585 [Ilyodon furcidens]|uniref:Uncharacterized protein n=1 Tax=Ilyodon furcidens TaxID=33524 RepID=A0ABV0UCQ7_9TELE
MLPNNDSEQGEKVHIGPGATASWGSQADLATALSPLEDVLELDYEDQDEVILELLVSKDDDEDELFILSPQAAKPGAPLVPREGGESDSLPRYMHGHTECANALHPDSTSPGLK